MHRYLLLTITLPTPTYAIMSINCSHNASIT